MSLAVAAAPSQVPLKNPSFEEGVAGGGVPVGWRLYRTTGESYEDVKLVLTADAVAHGRQALLIHDQDAGKEIGVLQTVPVEPGVWYEASVSVRRATDEPTVGAHMLLTFGPTYKLCRAELRASSRRSFNRISFKGQAPPDAKEANVYLYTHKSPTPQVIVDDVKLLAGVDPPPPPPPPPPKPVPPTYAKLKDLHLPPTSAYTVFLVQISFAAHIPAAIAIIIIPRKIFQFHFFFTSFPTFFFFFATIIY